MTTWIVNDIQTAIPGTRTLWHDLAEWLDGEWVGDAAYPLLAARVESLAIIRRPAVIIRNGTWFGPINLDVPTISLIQDIMPEKSYQRGEQIRVARLSALTVFNSEYTRAQYPELADITSRVIPLSVDFDLFRPIPNARPVADICWIGAPTWVKGWDTLGEIIRDMPTRTFALVLKEHSTRKVPDNVQVFTRVPHSDLPEIISGCQLGLCTSRQETQHLAGIEMAGCGLPIVAPNIGAYYDSRHAAWNGWRMNRSDVSSINWVMTTACPPHGTNNRVREEVMAAGFTREDCNEAWKEAVEWAVSAA
jgi:glycosyltransferase involved in cell wall biosynthesis